MVIHADGSQLSFRSVPLYLPDNMAFHLLFSRYLNILRNQIVCLLKSHRTYFTFKLLRQRMLRAH